MLDYMSWYCLVLSKGEVFTTSGTIFYSSGYVINKVKSNWLDNFQGGKAGQSAAWLCAEQTNTYNTLISPAFLSFV
jgi:hypothetical protein